MLRNTTTDIVEMFADVWRVEMSISLVPRIFLKVKKQTVKDTREGAMLTVAIKKLGQMHHGMPWK